MDSTQAVEKTAHDVRSTFIMPLLCLYLPGRVHTGAPDKLFQPPSFPTSCLTPRSLK